METTKPSDTTKNMDSPTKKTSRQEFNRTNSLRLPTPPPDPNQTNTDIFEQASALSKETMDKETEFLEYLNSLPVPSRDKPNLQRTTSVFAPAMAAEDAFDHLDKLYKVMEQLLNLRDQNAKLQRRIRDLEHTRTLQDMHRQIASAVLSGEDTDVPDITDDYMLAEAFLDNMFSSGKNKRSSKTKMSTQFRIGRNFSVASEETIKTPENLPDIPRNNSRKSLIETSNIKKTAKVSKWTKVKAAFKWEKATPTVTGAKSQDSGIGGMLPVNNELARYLRVPSSSDPNEQGVSPADSVLSGSWQGVHGLSTPGTISPASSTDDLIPSIPSEHRSVSRTGSAGTNNRGKRCGASPISDEEEGERRSRSLDYSTSFPIDANHPTKEELTILQTSKVHKTPWGKVKDIIQTRKDSLRKKQHRLSARSDDCKTDWSAGSDQEDVFESITQESEDYRAPTVTVTNTDDISCSRDKPSSSHDCEDRISPAVLARYQQTETEEDKCQIKPNPGSPRVNRRISKWTKVKKAFLTSAKTEHEEVQSVPASPTNKQYTFFYDTPDICKNDYYYNQTPRRKISEDDIKSRKIQEEIFRSYEQLQKKLSIEFQEKLLEWEKVKTANNVAPSAAVTQTSIPGSSTSEEQRDSDFARKMEEWEKIKYSNEGMKKKNIQLTSGENLPADFKKKLQEWEKIKKQGGKEDVTTKKKISDWQLWRSNSNHKQDINPQLGQPDCRQLSDDFLKKLDEWKQIKANRDIERSNSDQDHRKSSKDNKTPSPGLTRKGSVGKTIRHSKKFKVQEEKELQWLEKELQKIDREKQRLEREREKFLEREERLAKLRRSIGTSPHKKDVLVQTSTGFYRFEGISRKFTQRLYEWEKAKGIGPEASTIALLNTGYNQNCPNTNNTTQPQFKRESIPRIKLQRSKSMDSVANITFENSVMTHQPSSLSLNDMEELEMQCLADSQSQSEQNIDESEDNIDDGEPEAVLVEVEDLIEETAAPLVAHIVESRHHTPVYHMEVASLCESEKCEAPQVRRSESARALSSYNLIQETIMLLNKIIVSEKNCRRTELKIDTFNTSKNTAEKQNDKSTGAIPKSTNKHLDTKNYLKESLEQHYNQQIDLCRRLYTKFLLLQDANMSVVKNASSENIGYTVSQLADTIDVMQDISTELVTSTEKLKMLLLKRNKENKLDHEIFSNNYTQEIIECADSLTLKIMELKRSLTYICAASDMTAPGRKKKGSLKDRKFTYHRSLSSEATIEKIKKEENTTDEEEAECGKIKIKRKMKLVKSKSEDNPSNYAKLQVTSFGNNRKERAERSYKINFPLNTETHDQDEVINNENKEKVEIIVDNIRKREQRKLLRTRRISDGYVSYDKDAKPNKEIVKREMISLCENNVVIPTNIQYLDATTNEMVSATPVSIFVHTTRKLFTPFASETLDLKTENENNSNNEQKNTEIPEENAQHDNSNLCESSEILQNHSTRSSSIISQTIPTNTNLETSTEQNEKENSSIETYINNDSTMQDDQINFSAPIHLPPLPNSPVAQRRERTITKETSPAIRIMIARYNQKLSEQDSPGYKSGGSSGSASPVAWRSPVLERRVKTQSEKYQEEVNKTLFNNSKYSPLLAKKQVQKSASVGVMNVVKKQFTIPQLMERGSSLESSDKNKSPKLIRGILKSSSVDSLKKRPPLSSNNATSPLVTQCKTSSETTTTNIPTIPTNEETICKSNPIIQERAYKLQKAKEEFFHFPSTSSNPSSTRTEEIKFPTRNRLSQVSFGSESSCDDMNCAGLLVKSASAGMINIDEESYEQFRPEMHSQGYVSLPRTTKKKDDKFGISSITSKFRKVKMRRSKESSQMNAISALCRQSLVVDITLNSGTSSENSGKKKDEASTSKSSWLKNPTRIFKPKQ